MKPQGQVTEVAQESVLESTVTTRWLGGWGEHILKEKKTSFTSNPRGNMQLMAYCARAYLWERDNTHNLRHLVAPPFGTKTSFHFFSLLGFQKPLHGTVAMRNAHFCLGTAGSAGGVI